jgi:hypothetical protein
VIDPGIFLGVHGVGAPAIDSNTSMQKNDHSI